MPLRPMTTELIDEHISLGAWRRETLYEIVEEFSRQQPDSPAVADQHQRWTYRELLERASGLASYLESLQLAPGTSVALQSHNSNDIVLCHLACNKADLTFVPLSAAWREREIEHLLRTAEAAVAIVPGDDGSSFDFLGMMAAMRDRLPALRAVGTTTPAGADFSLAEVAVPGEIAPARPHDPNTPRFVMVTSGTTDLPKMSLWTDNDLWYFMSEYARAVAMTPADRCVGLAPASTGSTGYCFPVLAPVMHGASSVLLEHWEPAAALRLLSQERGTIATAIPTQIIKMLQEDIVGELDFSELRVFTNAGAPMPSDVAEEVDKVFGCMVQPLYGATDGGVPTMTTVYDAPQKRYTTVGKLLPHTTVRLVDANLNDVGPGEAGEILWRQPMKTSYGYMNEPERTGEAFVGDGFYRSGDLGQFDDEGYLRIVGRVKDIIIRGGQNISPREIEDLAATHPAISEIAVIGLPDPVYGERTCACVVLRPGATLTLEQLNEHLLAQQLAKFKLPERLVVLEGELPKSAGAKVSKADLRVYVRELDAAQSAQ